MTSAAAAQTDHPAWTPVPPARTPRDAAADPGAEPEPEPHSAQVRPAEACPAEVCWQFPPLPVHARMARIWLEAWIADRGPGEEAAYCAAVAFSELVTNAVLHGSGPVTVRVRVEPERVECEVSDAACDLPVVYEAGDEDEHHRGMSLVDALTTSWQVRRRAGGGKSVAFAVEASAAEAGSLEAGSLEAGTVGGGAGEVGCLVGRDSLVESDSAEG